MIRRVASSTGTARPSPTPATAVFTPTTSPVPLARAPPELPGFSAASVWTTFSTRRCGPPRPPTGSERPRAETTPAVTEPPKPCGLPMATTSWPTCSRPASPRRAAGGEAARCRRASTRRTARSERGSRPTTRKRSSEPSTKVAVPSRAPSTTWALVSRKPSGVMTTPLPAPIAVRPPRTRRATRRLATLRVSSRATVVTTVEYASSASASVGRRGSRPARVRRGVGGWARSVVDEEQGVHGPTLAAGRPGALEPDGALARCPTRGPTASASAMAADSGRTMTVNSLTSPSGPSRRWSRPSTCLSPMRARKTSACGPVARELVDVAEVLERVDEDREELADRVAAGEGPEGDRALEDRVGGQDRRHRVRVLGLGGGTEGVARCAQAPTCAAPGRTAPATRSATASRDLERGQVRDAGEDVAARAGGAEGRDEGAGLVDDGREVGVAPGDRDRAAELVEPARRLDAARAGVVGGAVGEDRAVHRERELARRAADAALGLRGPVEPQPGLQPQRLLAVGGLEPVGERDASARRGPRPRACR